MGLMSLGHSRNADIEKSLVDTVGEGLWGELREQHGSI